MNEWEEAIDCRTFQFVEELERRGFRADGRTLTGALAVDLETVAISITLPDTFPFTPPKVTPPSDFPRSWHRERDGAMCLYPADGRDGLPWLKVDWFLALVTRWIVESRTGWPGDFPDLDLERYFLPSRDPLVVYGDLDELDAKSVQLHHLPHVTQVTGPGSTPKRTSRSRDRAFGYVTDIGEPDAPPAGWDSIKASIPSDDRKDIERAVVQGRLTYLIVRYTRGGVRAAVVLRVSKGAIGKFDLASVRSASEAPATLRLRAGAAADLLVGARVAVVGVGAIGSFVCDLLARAGVGSIDAYDTDIVRPGNLIRYLAGEDTVGLGKPSAVKQVIESRPYLSPTVTDHEAGAPSPNKVMDLFAESDLVIDATASGDVTGLLISAATSCNRSFISVCLQEEGGVVRVDVLPPLDGATSLPPTELGPPPAREELRFEAGCGDPISQTPAYAVYEAASLAVRHAVGLLTGSPISNVGTIRDYR